MRAFILLAALTTFLAACTDQPAVKAGAEPINIVVDSVGPDLWKYTISIDPLKMRDTLSRITEVEAISNAENKPTSQISSKPYQGNWTLSPNTSSIKWNSTISGTNWVSLSLRGDFKNGQIYLRVSGSLDSSGQFPFSRMIGPIAGPVM